MSSSPYTPIKEFYDACKNNGIILDTNMLILYIVGQLGESAIDQEKRLSKSEHVHTWDEFKVVDLLVRISKIRKVIFTPYAIPEVSHLLEIEKNRKKRSEILNKHKYHDSIIRVLCDSEELPQNAKEILLQNEELLERFGFTDLSIIHSIDPAKPFAVLTDDGQLCDFLSAKQLPSLSLARLNAYGVGSDNLIARLSNIKC